MRIVSLLPSATEIICALGLEDQLVGVTHECDVPETVRRLPAVTRTLIPTDAPSAAIDALVRERLQTTGALYTLDLPTLAGLAPDLIVTQALCEVCAVAETEVRAAACGLPGNPPVVNLEPTSLAGVFDAIRQVARAAGVPADGDRVVATLEARVADVVARAGTATDRPRVALLEWLDPPFASGHWNPELVRLAGGVDVLGREGEKSRRVTWDEVRAARPDVVVVSCCGYGVERTLEDVPLIPADLRAPVSVVNGSHYFSRPGPRLVDSLEILAHILHPELLPPPDPPRYVRIEHRGPVARGGRGVMGQHTR